MGNEPIKAPEKPVKEQIREEKRNVERSMRSIEREIKKLERDERKIITEMKKMGQKGQVQAAKQMAKEVARIRNQTSKMNQFCGHLKAVTLKLSSVSTLNEMSDAMANATKAMCLVTNKLDSTKLANMHKEMAMADGKLEMKNEMFNTILEDIGEDLDDPVEQEKVYQDILKEVGLEVKNQMPDAPVKKQEKEEVKVEKDSIDDMLKSLNMK